MATKPKAPAYPKKPGQWPDRLKEMSVARLEKKHDVDAMEADEKAFKAFIIEELPKQTGGTGVSGDQYKIEIKEKAIPQVQDWEAFAAWIIKKKDLAVLNRALNYAHIEELWDAGVIIPGLVTFDAKTISLTKK